MNVRTFRLLASVALLLLPSLALGVGIGISPTRIEVGDAMRGLEYERPLTVFNPADEANNFTLHADGEAGDWIAFYSLTEPRVRIGNMSIGGRGTYHLLVMIAVPPDEAGGAYNATIYAETIPVKISEGTGVAAVLMAKTAVFVNVTGEQVVGGAVKAIFVDDTEPAYALRIRTVFQNTGNVVARPVIALSIMRGGILVANFTDAGARVRPASTDTIVTEWNTTPEHAVGNYTAKVVVSLDGRELISDSLPFRILPAGTFTRQGNLTRMVLDGAPAVDSVVKLQSFFRNTGRLDTPAKFSGEVYLDGKLVGTLASEELKVGEDEESPLTSYLKLTSPGNYVLKGRVIYEGKETEFQEVSFSVPAGDARPGFDARYLLAAVPLLLAAVLLVRRRARGSSGRYAYAGVFPARKTL